MDIRAFRAIKPLLRELNISAPNAATDQHIQALDVMGRHYACDCVISRAVHTIAHRFAKACLGGSLRQTPAEWDEVVGLP